MKTILLLDTDIQQVKIMTSFLENQGFELISCSNLLQLEKLLKNYPVELIVINSTSPKLSESINLKKLITSKPVVNFPFLIISNDGEWKDLSVEDNKILNTPLNYTLLIEEIRKQLKNNDYSAINISTEQKLDTNIKSIAQLKEFISKNSENFQFEKDSIIYKTQKSCAHLYLLEKGLVKTYIMDEYGKELITGIYKENDLFGMYAVNKKTFSPESAMALENSSIFKFSIQSFHEFLEKNNELSLEFVDLLSENIINLKEHLLDMAYASVLKKTSNTLLQLAENTLQDHTKDITLSRNDLASVAGISPESLIRSLGILKKDKLIAVKGRAIKVLDKDKLTNIK